MENFESDSLLATSVQTGLKINYENHLEGHDISYSQRAKFIDWMLQVYDVLKLSERSFFFAMDLLDKYLMALKLA